jgi:rare lipoprotein A
VGPKAAGRPIIRNVMIFLAALSLALAAGCASKVPEPPPGTKKPGTKRPATQRPYSIRGKTYHPIPSAAGYRETGYASWYGPNFHGRRTSNGEVYDMDEMTAAHKILPMNTYVQVTNLRTGQKSVVRINDRGPFVDGRIIDLSREAAKKVGVYGPGTAKVNVVALGFKKEGRPVTDKPSDYVAPASYRKGPFSVQVGAFTSESNAWRLAASLRPTWGKVTVVRYDRGDMVFHRVRVDRLTDLTKAQELQQKLREAGFKNAYAVAD